MKKNVIYIAAPLLILLLIFPLLTKEIMPTAKLYSRDALESWNKNGGSYELGGGGFTVKIKDNIARTSIKVMDGYDFDFSIDLCKGDLIAGKAAFSGSGYWSPNVENSRFFRKIKTDNPNGLLRGANCYAVKTPEGMFFVIRCIVRTSGYQTTLDITFPLSPDDEISNPVELPNLEALETTELEPYNAKTDAR
ncbi:MAG: hypothetical protein AB7F40_09745 [Victivallaceae bacterium]|nr:hypothetical protein [Victivallaceae bacterium]